MRKPLLVGVLTSVVLVSGGVLATGSALAQTAPTSTVEESRVSTTRAQRQVLNLVNQSRRRTGCGPLSLDRRLTEAAQAHATDMARGRYFAHSSRNGENAGERVADEGYRWRRYGENIARGPGSSGAVVNGWMRSPGHRRNILDCGLHEMGVGLAFDSRHRPYWVQDFATPR